MNVEHICLDGNNRYIFPNQKNLRETIMNLVPFFYFAHFIKLSRLKFNQTTLEMNELHILTLLTISGAMRITPTLFKQFLKNIHPLNQFL